MPSMRGILMSKMARSGGLAFRPVERARAVGVGLHPVSLRLERQGDGGQDVAVVVDQRDRGHEAPALISIPSPLGRAA